MIKILTEGEFQESVIDVKGKVLVEFFAPWCPHCQRMMPVIEDVAEKLHGNVAVYQVDVDQSPDLTEQYTDGFPAFVLFEDGQVIDEIEGETTEESIFELVSE